MAPNRVAVLYPRRLLVADLGLEVGDVAVPAERDASLPRRERCFHIGAT
jgi:hypothetical protein